MVLQKIWGFENDPFVMLLKKLGERKCVCHHGPAKNATQGVSFDHGFISIWVDGNQ